MFSMEHFGCCMAILMGAAGQDEEREEVKAGAGAGSRGDGKELDSGKTGRIFGLILNVACEGELGMTV